MSLEVAIDLENMIPIQISLQMNETEKAETVEQLLRALQLTGPGMIDQQLRLIKERDPLIDDPLIDVYREFWTFPKKRCKNFKSYAKIKTSKFNLPPSRIWKNCHTG